MFNYFYDVLPHDIQEVIWKMIWLRQMKDLHHSHMTGTIWEACGAQAEEMTKPSQFTVYPQSDVTVWRQRYNDIAKRLYCFRKIKEYNSPNNTWGGPGFYANNGMIYRGRPYVNALKPRELHHLQLFVRHHLQEGRAQLGIPRSACFHSGKTIIHRHMFPHVEPYIELSDGINANKNLLKNGHHLTVKELKEFVRQKELKGFSNMKKSDLVSYYYTESKTRKIGEICGRPEGGHPFK
jgi:hypothetical protein